MAAGGDVVLLARAYAFAAARHGGHRRKGLAQEPYVNHLVEVAELVAEATAGADAALVAAAVLHDVVEDTRTTAEEVRDGFGEDVMTLVLEVTDDKTLPKAERKRQQVVDGPHKSARAKVIKLADTINNVSALLVCPAARRPWRARPRASPSGGRTGRTAGGSRGWRDPGLASGARGRPPRVSGRPTRAGGGRCRPDRSRPAAARGRGGWPR